MSKGRIGLELEEGRMKFLKQNNFKFGRELLPSVYEKVEIFDKPLFADVYILFRVIQIQSFIRMKICRLQYTIYKYKKQSRKPQFVCRKVKQYAGEYYYVSTVISIAQKSLNFIIKPEHPSEFTVQTLKVQLSETEKYKNKLYSFFQPLAMHYSSIYMDLLICKPP